MQLSAAAQAVQHRQFFVTVSAAPTKNVNTEFRWCYFFNNEKEGVFHSALKTLSLVSVEMMLSFY